MWVILWEQIEDRTPVHSFGIWCSVVLYNVLHGSTSPCHTARSHISSLLNPDSQLPTFSSQKDSPIGLLLTSVIRHQVEVLRWSSWLSVLACTQRCLTVKFDRSVVAQAPINVSAISTRGCRLGRIIHSEESILLLFFKVPQFFSFLDEMSCTRALPGSRRRSWGRFHPGTQTETVQTTGNRQDTHPLPNKPQWQNPGWAIVSFIKLSLSRQPLRYERVLVKTLSVTHLHGWILVSGGLI